jgi:hypothetical protein
MKNFVDTIFFDTKVEKLLLINLDCIERSFHPSIPPPPLSLSPTRPCHLALCLSVCLPACLPIDLSICLSVCLSVYISNLSIYLSFFVSIHLLFIWISLLYFFTLCVCLRFSLFLYLSVCTSFSLFDSHT